MRLLLLLLPLLVASATSAFARQSLFTADWRFHLGDAENAQATSFDDQSWRPLSLPHDWSIEGDFSTDHASGTGFLPGGIGWYRKHFKLPPESSGRRILIRFEGVYRHSDVWINGHHLGHRPNGYIDFEYDLTPHLKEAGQENVLAVRVARENVADSRWYTGTGIYRDVWLTMVNPVHVQRHGVFLTTPQVTESFADVNSVCEVINTSDKDQRVTVSAVVMDIQGKTIAQAQTSRDVSAGSQENFPLYHPVNDPKLWSPASPYLYQVTHKVEINGNTVDEVTTPLGIRTFHFDPNEGFFLNGVNMLIKGVCNHHDAGNLGAVMPRAVLKRRLQILKDIGVNAIRCSHNPMQDDLYELCDEMGFLMMDEAFDEWELGKRKWVKGRNKGHSDRFGYSEDFEEWAVRDAEAMVRRARKHPSVILYSIGNEIDYPTDPYVHPRSRQVEIFKDAPGQPSMTRLAAVAPSLIAAVKKHDPTRPVTMAISNAPAANAIGLSQMLDVVGYNYQEAAYDRDHAQFPGRILIGSENSDRTSAWKAVADKPFISGQFLWTGFDFLGEAGVWPAHGSSAGIFDIAGFPKFDALRREAFWSDKPVLHLGCAQGRRGGWRNRWDEPPQPDSPVNVYVTTNLAEVTLSQNGEVIGTAQSEDGMANWTINWKAGEITATGKTPSGEIISDTLTAHGPPAQLRLSPDRTTLDQDGRDAIHVVVELVDKNGIRVPSNDELLSVTTSGGVQLAALENGDLRDNSHPKSSSRRLRHGRALAIFQASGEGSGMQAKFEVEGLPPQTLDLSPSVAPRQ